MPLTGHDHVFEDVFEPILVAAVAERDVDILESRPVRATQLRDAL